MNIRPTIKRALKIAVGAALVLALLLLAGAVALWIFLPRERIKNTLIEQLSKKLNQDVMIADVTVGFFPDAELVVEGVHVADSQTSQRIISAQEIRVETDLVKLVKGEYSLECIVVNAPVIHLIRDKDGKWNAQKLVSGMELPKRTAPKKPDAAEPSGEPPVRMVHIRNGSINVCDEASGRNFTIEQIEAVFDQPQDLLAVPYAVLRFPPIDASLSGKVTKVSRPDRILGIDTTLHVKKQGPLADFGSAALAADGRFADILLSVSGPTDRITLKGMFALENLITAGLTTNGSIEGALFPKEARFELAHLGVDFGKSRLSLNGSCTELWGSERKANLTGTAKVLLAEALAPLGENAVSRIEPDGWANMTFELAGSMEEMDVKTELDITEAGVTIHKTMRKPPGMPGSLNIDARYLIPNELIADRLELKIADAEVLGTATLRPGTKPWFQLSANTKRIPLKMLDRLPSICFEGGAAAANIELWQSTPAQRSADYVGEARVKDALLIVERMNEPFEISDSIIEFSSKVASMETSFLFDGKRNKAKAEVSHFGRPHIAGALQTEVLDINKITSSVVKRESRRRQEDAADSSHPEFYPRFSLEVLMEADSMYAGMIETGPVITTWQTNGRLHRFEPSKVKAFGGELEGMLEMRTGEGALKWVADFSGKNLELEKLSAQLRNDGKTNIKGPLNARANLTGAGASQGGSAMRSLAGDISLTVASGEITRYSWLKNIFLMIQLSPATFLVPGLREIAILNALVDAAKTRGRSLNPTNIAFTGIGGTFHINNGVAHTEDLRLESGIANLMFRGDIDLAEKRMDMIVRAAPLGSVGSLVEKIPLAGGTLNRAKEAAISTDFIVCGPLSDPDVKLEAMDKVLPGSD